MGRLAKFRRLRLGDKRLLIRALVVVVLARTALSLIPFHTLRRRMPAAATGTASERKLRRIGWAVSQSAKLVPGASCLTQALAATFLLTRAGVQADIRVGVAKDDAGRFLAHAWVLSHDRVVVGGSGHDLERYSVLTDLNLRAS